MLTKYVTKSASVVIGTALFSAILVVPAAQAVELSPRDWVSQQLAITDGSTPQTEVSYSHEAKGAKGRTGVAATTKEPMAARGDPWLEQQLGLTDGITE